MPQQFTPRPMRPANNAKILNTIRKNASRDYRERVQPATQANLTQQLSDIMDFQATRNEFMDALVNRIGLVIARNKVWDNPLRKFHRGMLNYGETIEEVQTGLLTSHIYDPTREYLERDLFGIETPDARSAFHKINREEFYRVTINDQILKRAFLEEGGLQGYISQLMSAPATSDNWDEFLMTTQLIREFYDADGFFKVQVPNLRGLSSDADDARYAFKALRSMIDTLPFLSTNYNAAGMPVFADPDELEILITPQANAALDVDALAGAFNMDRMNVASRMTVIPEDTFNVPGGQMVLTTRDFFVNADTVMTTTSQPNAAGLTTNYFLHHHEILSVSPFAPAVLFTTEPSTPIVITDPVVTAVQPITAKNRSGVTVTDLPRGEFYQISTGLDTTPAGANVGVVLDLVTRPTSNFTRLDNNGGLLVGVDELNDALVIKASASPDYLTGDDVPTPQLATFTLSGDVAQLFPPKVIAEADAEAPGETAMRALSLSADEGDDELFDTPIPEPAGNASRDEWAAYAHEQGAPESETAPLDAGGLGRDELRAKYGTAAS